MEVGSGLQTFPGPGDRRSSAAWSPFESAMSCSSVIELINLQPSSACQRKRLGLLRAVQITLFTATV